MEYLNNNLVINLKHRIDRWKHTLIEFEKLGLIANRFDAIKNQDGRIGCTMSHIKCLEYAIENDLDYILISEDDITFLNPVLLENSLKNFIENVNDWDVLLLGANVNEVEKKNNNYLKIIDAQTTTGYIVKKHYFNTLLDNFKEGLQLLEKEKKGYYCIDIHWKKIQSKDKWYILYPFTVTQYDNYSDIEKRNTDYKKLMLTYKNENKMKMKFF